MTPGPRPTERLEKTLARVAREQGIDQERLRRWVSFLALCGVLERAVSEGALGTYYLKGGVAMELRFAQRARATKDLDIGIDGARSQGTPPTPDAAGPPATGATRRNSPAVGLIRKPSISSLPPTPSLQRWDEALSTARQAHNLAVRAKQTQLAEAIRQRLALYREHRPYRAPSTVP